MSSKVYHVEHLEQYLKFEDNIPKILSGLPKDKSLFREIIKYKKRKPIPCSVIKLFYEQPNKFFAEYHKLLDKTSYVDYTDTSIFLHYFYILYDKYKNKNSNINYSIYESNFDNFFKENQFYFLVQDLNLDTALIKLAKMSDKSFFFEIYEKLKKLDMIGNECLLLKNIENKSISTYIFEDIKYNPNKIKNVDLYYKFINDNYSVYEAFNNEDHYIIKKFKLKVIFETKEYKEENYNEIFDNINQFINNNKDKIFECIYFPFESNINYLNCLYQICSNSNDYDKLFNLFIFLTKKTEILRKICISRACLIDHIEYVLLHMNSTKKKGEHEMNYAIKLIKQNAVKVILNKNIDNVYINPPERKNKKGFVEYLTHNNNINFDKKYEFYKIISEIISININKYLDKHSLKLYNFFEFVENNNINTCDINKIKDNEYLKEIIEENKSFRLLINEFIRFCPETDKNKKLEFVAKYLKNLMKNNYNLLKHKYDVSDDKEEKILIMLIRVEIALIFNEIKDFTDKPNKLDNFFFKMSKDLYFSLEEEIFKNNFMNYVDIHEPQNIIEIIAYCPYDLCKVVYQDYNPDYLKIYKKIYDFYKKEENFIEYKFIKKINEYIPLLKQKSFSAEIFAFFILIFDITEDPQLLFPKRINLDYFTYQINYYNKKYWHQLLISINEPFDFSEIANFICENFLIIYKLFRDKSKMLLCILKELDPTLNIGLYSNIVGIVEKYSPIIKNNIDIDCEKYEHSRMEESAFEFNYLLIFLYIKKKYEKDNPNLVAFLLAYLINFNDKGEIVSLFNDAFYKNNIQNIFDNFIFKEFSYDNENYKAFDYFKNNKNIIEQNLINLKKWRKCTFNQCIELIKPILNGYVYFNHPNLKITFNHFKKYWKDTKVLSCLIFHLDFSKNQNNENEDKDKDDNLYFILNKIRNSYSLLSILDIEQNKFNKNIFNNMISKIEQIISNYENYYVYSDKEIINNNVINNLYELLMFNKSENNKFLDLAKRYESFLNLICVYFHHILSCFKKKNSLKIENKKIEFIKKEIYDFCIKDTVNYRKSIIIKYEPFAIEYTNQLINKIKKLKDLNSIRTEIKELLEYASDLYFSKKYPKYFQEQWEIILGILLEKNQEEFLSLFEQVKNKNSDIKGFNKKLMSINIGKYINCLPEIINLCYLKKDLIIKNIIKNKKYEFIDNENVKKCFEEMNDYESYILLINYADGNKDASKYFLNKLKTNFYKDEETIFIDFIVKNIKNQYIFDTILKNISKKKDRNYFESNKEIIIQSLYRYSEINGYYYIEQLLEYMKKNMSLDDFSNIILNPDIIVQEIVKDINIDEKNGLLIYASSKKKLVQNYETLAILMNYCQNERAILEIFPSIYDRYNIFDVKVQKYIKYFSNSKNKDKIKSLNKFMYNFSLFLESLARQIDYIESLENNEKDIFFNYIKINVLEITPPILFTKSINDNNDELTKMKKRIGQKANINIFKDNQLDEIQLCIIFALYEIKGIPLIPIKKYLPEFYMKIENYCKTFKNLKIPEICLKQSLDVKFNDNFIKSLKNNLSDIRDYFYDCYNIMFIFDKEYGNIFGNQKYLQKDIYNLINNNNIITFANNNEKIEQFIEILKAFNYKDDPKDNDISSNFVEECIFSLKDFTRTSSVLIQKCFEEFDNSESLSGSILNNYKRYLNIISDIYNHIILNSKSNFDNNNNNKKNKNANIIEKNDIFILKDLLFQSDSNKLIALKNSININQIKYYIINGFKKYYNDETKEIMGVWEKWIDSFIKQKYITQNINNNITFLNYITCLAVYCECIINWIDKLDSIFTKDFKINHQLFKIKFIEESNKEKAKKLFSDNLYKLCLDFINRSRAVKNGRQSNSTNFNYQINFYYYFDENLGDYVETSTNRELFYYIQKKIDNINEIFNYKDQYNINDLLLDITFALESKDIKYLFSKIMFDIEDNRQKSNDFNKLFNNLNSFFEKFYSKYREFLPNYMKNNELVEELGSESRYRVNLEKSITYEIKNFFNNYIMPIFYSNTLLYFYNENKDWPIPYIKIFIDYKEYINFTNLINDICNTKFHKNENLNELFKIKAINYLLNDDSLLNLFIGEIYTSIKLKICDKINKKYKIKDTFEIKITKGKSYGKSDYNNLKKIEEERIRNELVFTPKPKKKKKRIVLKLKTNEEKKNNNIHFAVFKKNLFKREFIPNINYGGHIPLLQFSLELSRGKLLNQAFGNEFMSTKNQSQELFIPEIDKTIKAKGRKHKKPNFEVFVNVFDLIYTVKSIKKNEIMLCKNDISSVLDQYSEPSIFMSLLNYNFPPKRDEDINYDFEIIKKYVNENH